MKDLILVTGTQRSGVSVLGGVLWACGSRGGRIALHRINGGRGGFENTDIRDCLVRPYLDSLGSDPRGQNPLPGIEYLQSVSEDVITTWRGTVERVFEGQTPGSVRNFYSSTLSALLWPIWLRAFPEARWLIVRRRREEVLNACLQTSWMDGYSDAPGWNGWIDHYEQCFAEIASRAPAVSIWPHDAPTAEAGLVELESAVTSLGLEWNREKVYALVAPTLWWKDGAAKGQGSPT